MTTPTDQIKQILEHKDSRTMSGTREDGLGRVEAEISELKSENKITGFKIYRIEKSLDDMKEILERLTDVYHNQNMIQKDIVTIFKDISELNSKLEESKKTNEPLQSEISEHMASVKTGARVLLAVISILYGVGAWTVNKTLEYTKENNERISSVEKTLIEQRLDIVALKDNVIEIQRNITIEKESLLSEVEKIRKSLSE